MNQNIEVQPKSKSQIKRELYKLQALGKQLVALSNKQLINIPISDKIRDAIVAAKSFKYGALSRQLKYIGNLMPNEDETSIRLALDKLQQLHKNKTNGFHELENWRDRLLQGDQVLLDELVNRFNNFERQHASQLIRNAIKELKLNKPPRSARLLFKYITEMQGN